MHCPMHAIGFKLLSNHLRDPSRFFPLALAQAPCLPFVTSRPWLTSSLVHFQTLVHILALIHLLPLGLLLDLVPLFTLVVSPIRALVHLDIGLFPSTRP